MEEYRAEQQRKWRESQAAKQAEAPAPEAPAPEAPDSPPPVVTIVSDAVPNRSPRAEEGAPETVRRVHVLPVEGPHCEKVDSSNMVTTVGPWLRARRSAKLPIWKGLKFKTVVAMGDNTAPSADQTVEFVVVCCEPERGLIDKGTQYYFDGAPVVRFRKIQYMAFNLDGPPPADDDTAALFQQHLEPLVKARMATDEDLATVGLMQVNEHETAGGKQFVVTATDPPGIGIVDKNTCVYVDWDNSPEFTRVHCLPFADTIPRAYEFDLFEDYLRPYFHANPTQTFKKNDIFKFRGIQFKVMCTDPEDVTGRVGKRTTVFCEGHLQPSIRDLLPPELAAQISRFPPGLQMLLLSSDVMGGDVYERLMEMHEMLNHRRGMDQNTVERLPKIIWSEAEAANANGQTNCMVCLCDYEEGEELYKLPCNHLFHPGCIAEWLTRCTDCPLCKTNIDRQIREY
jgi:hypothetical protein